jgi:hypothetical protein
VTTITLVTDTNGDHMSESKECQHLRIKRGLDRPAVCVDCGAVLSPAWLPPMDEEIERWAKKANHGAQ